MGFSALASRAVAHHGKYSPRQGTAVRYLIVHHWAGTSGGDARLVNPAEAVSASYILYSDGSLVGQVPEEYRPWTSGSWDADAPAVTVETQNSGGSPDWPVSDAALERLAQLAADLCRRYGWGSLDRSRVRGHREFYATACPGPYLWARLDYIVQRGNQILAGSPTTNTQEDDMTPEQAKQLKAVYDATFTTSETSRGTIRGILGMLKILYDVSFKTSKTSAGTPGGLLPSMKVMLDRQDEILARLDKLEHRE